MSQFAVAQAPSGGGMPPASPARADRAGADAASFAEALGKAGRASGDRSAGQGATSAERKGDGGREADGEGAAPAKPDRAGGREAAADPARAVGEEAGEEAGARRTVTIETAAIEAGKAAGAGAALLPDVASDARGPRKGEQQGSAADGRDAPGKPSAAAQPGGPAAAVMAVMPYLNARSADGAARQAGPRAPSGPPAMEGRIPGGNGLAGTALAPSAPGGGAGKVDAAIGAASAVKGVTAAPETGARAAALAGPGEGGTQKSAPALAGKPALPAAGVSGQADGARPQPSAMPLAMPLDLGRILAGEGDLPASMRDAVASHVARVMAVPAHGQPVSVLRIQLQPAHLGQVNVTMRLSAEQVQVTLTPDSASAARVLGSDQEAITTVLRSLGGAFAGASIEVGGEAGLRQGLDDGAARDAAARQGDAFQQGERRSSGEGARDGPGEAGESVIAGGGAVSATTADGRIII